MRSTVSTSAALHDQSMLATQISQARTDGSFTIQTVEAGKDLRGQLMQHQP
ncbi:MULTISPECIES: hypothetical protein [Cobetia]|uniref:hypothetical protein n=1 Tax=Cobetia TaxID=204286 RepID=UPI0014837D4F|nr:MULTISPECIES: hypothetical protein [Cobetia]